MRVNRLFVALTRANAHAAQLEREAHEVARDLTHATAIAPDERRALEEALARSRSAVNTLSAAYARAAKLPSTAVGGAEALSAPRGATLPTSVAGADVATEFSNDTALEREFAGAAS